MRSRPAVSAMAEVQDLVFAPLVFQAAVTLVRGGLLAKISAAGEHGLSLEEAATDGRSHYGCEVLLSVAARFGILEQNTENARYRLGRLGYFLLNDEMTRVNLDFVQDVCFQGAFFLEEAVQTGRPAGLRVFGDHDTVYTALSSLPEPVRKSWLAFDHFYSDAAFPRAAQLVLERAPATLLDIGGNTGRFARLLLKSSEQLKITIFDLPGQVGLAEQTGLNDARLSWCAADIRRGEPLPSPMDAVWMSQFLDCFADGEIVSILGRARAALSEHGSVYLLEPLIDRQPHPAGGRALAAASLYFTCIANGNSRFFSEATLAALVDQAGLVAAERWDGLGTGHSLWRCIPKG